MKATQIFKKIEYFDNLISIKTERITIFRNQWLFKWGNTNANIMVWIKQAIRVKEKEKEKANKVREKN